jgi:hypothetical protein
LKILSSGWAAVAAVTLFVSGSAAPSNTNVRVRSHAPAIIHERQGTMVTSTNWSGYAVTGAKGSVTDVKRFLV